MSSCQQLNILSKAANLTQILVNTQLTYGLLKFTQMKLSKIFESLSDMYVQHSILSNVKKLFNHFCLCPEEMPTTDNILSKAKRFPEMFSYYVQLIPRLEISLLE